MADERTSDPVPHWDRTEMETDDGHGGTDSGTGTPDAEEQLWNKGQMAEESVDGSGGPDPTADIDAPGGLSGEGSNPGGGERWADRDREGQ